MSQSIALGFAEGLTALQELRVRAQAGHHMFAIMLAGGALISSKDIEWEPCGFHADSPTWDACGDQPCRWYIVNEIDGTEVELTDEGLWSESNIGEALDKRALLDMHGGGVLSLDGRPAMAESLIREADLAAIEYRKTRAQERAKDPLRLRLSSSPGALRFGEDEWEPADPSLLLEPCDIGPATVASIDLTASMLDFVDSRGEPQPNGVYMMGGSLVRGASTSIELTIEDIDELIATLKAIRDDAVAYRGFALNKRGWWTNGREGES